MAYGPSLAGMFRRAAYHVDQILRGKPVAEIPVKRPTTFELVLNRKTAEALGINLPGTVIARAHEVIE